MLVSVIIPTYNRSIRLRSAIESVLAQTHQQFELIVVDDGSTDDTKDVVQSFPGVKYVYQENRRQGAARNRGLRECIGEVVASLDSDDIWDQDFLEKGLHSLTDHDASFVFCNYRVVSEGKVIAPDLFSSLTYLKHHYNLALVNGGGKLNVEEGRRLFLQHSPAPSSSLLVKRNFLKGWIEDAWISDDRFIVIEALLQGAIGALQAIPSWSKERGNDNICDGHANFYNLANKEIMDLLLLIDHFGPRLSFDEITWVLDQKRLSEQDAAYFAARGGHLGLALRHQRAASIPGITRSSLKLARLFLVWLKNRIDLSLVAKF